MRVVKVGGRVQNDARLPSAIAAAWHRAPGSLCLVHGGGDEIGAMQRALGLEPAFERGRRLTTPADLNIVRMVLSGTINKRLVAALLSAGVQAVGLSGEDAALIGAQPLDAGRLGRVGAPERINVALLWHLLDGGFLPVLSPVSRDRTSDMGDGLNVNGDDVAAALAVALGAEELFFMTDVEGLLVDGVPVSVLDADEAEEAIVSGIAAGGMAAKLQAGMVALAGGVGRVRLGWVNVLDDHGAGTLVVPARRLANGTKPPVPRRELDPGAGTLPLSQRSLA